MNQKPSKKYSWGGNRALPVSFFLFFFLMFFLLGEQLVALPIYVIGPGENGPDKVSILDLGWSDALHRPLFFLLFSFIAWMMFSSFSWPIVWIGAASLWFVFKWIFPDPGKTQSVWTFIGVGFFLLVPYFLYRAINYRWGARGMRRALWILVVLNIMFLGFFAYQIYGLGNSYYGYARGSLITQNQMINLAMITPYISENDIARIEPYSSSKDAPWGFEHRGLDFFPASDLVPFRAITDGTITNFEVKENGDIQFCIEHNPFLVCYAFEIASSSSGAQQKQLDNIFVTEGMEVTEGDVVGKLVYSPRSHVDIGVLFVGADGSRICPAQYFTEEAKGSILRIIHKNNPTWKLCYE